MWRWLAVGLAIASTGASAAPGAWSTNGPWGGFVFDFDIHPTVPTTLYATTNSGLYKSSDGGSSWARADNGIPTGVATTLGPLLEVDQPDTLYIFDFKGRLYRSDDGAENWAPTGFSLPLAPMDWEDLPGAETFAIVLNQTSVPGEVQLRKTVDGGATFFGAGTGLPIDRPINVVRADAASPMRLLAGVVGYAMPSPTDPSDPSIYRSLDGGATWSGVLATGTGSVTTVSSISFGAGSTVYAHVGNRIYRSGDDGTTWSLPLATVSGAQRLTAHPTDAAVLYSGTGTGLFKSIDSGATFTQVMGGLTPNSTYLHATTLAPVPGDVQSIEAEPGFPAPGAGLWVATVGGGLFKSVDGGASYSVAGVNEGLGGVNVRSLLVHPNPATRPVGGPGNRIYAGFGDVFASSPAAFLSTNGATTWNPSNNQLRGAQWRVVIVDRTTAGVTAGQVSSSVLFAAGRAAQIPGYRNGGIYKSTNGGATWASFDAGLPTRTLGGITAADVGTVRGLALDPRSCTLPPTGACASGPLKRLYATATGFTTAAGPDTFTISHRLVRSDTADTAAPSWIDVPFPGGTRISGAVPQDSITPLTVLISPTDSNVLYVGTFSATLEVAGAVDIENGVFKSIDGGATWVHASNGLPRRSGYTNYAHDVLAMAMHPTNGDILWATTILTGVEGTASLYKTIDGGATWTESASGISSGADLRALIVDATDPNTLYTSGAGDEANPGSVFKSEDGGATWRSISIGLPRDAALALTLDPFVPTVLHAGTVSGVWSIEQVPDADDDGVPDGTENNTPGAVPGDGNGDGQQDGVQKDVGSTVVILRPGPKAAQGAGGFFTADIVSGSASTPGGCTQLVDVHAQLAARHGRDFVDGVRFYNYPRDLVRFEILDCESAVVDLTFHNADFQAQFGWSFRYYGPLTPGDNGTFGFYDFASRATRVAPNKWRLTLDANQFGSYRPTADSILFEGGPACFDDRTFQNGFENGTGFTPPACN